MRCLKKDGEKNYKLVEERELTINEDIDIDGLKKEYDEVTLSFLESELPEEPTLCYFEKKGETYLACKNGFLNSRFRYKNLLDEYSQQTSFTL